MKDNCKELLTVIADDLVNSLYEIKEWESAADTIAAIMRAAMLKADVSKFETENAKFKLTADDELAIEYNSLNGAHEETLH